MQHIPSGNEIAVIETGHPGTVIELEVCEGMRLSDAVDQNSSSYVLGLIYVGGENEAELLSYYYQSVQNLHFEIEDA